MQFCVFTFFFQKVLCSPFSCLSFQDSNCIYVSSFYVVPRVTEALFFVVVISLVTSQLQFKYFLLLSLSLFIFKLIFFGILSALKPSSEIFILAILFFSSKSSTQLYFISSISLLTMVIKKKFFNIFLNDSFKAP